ncbi:MAG: septum formation initiator family protein, partial [Candidatus Eremiobacterota bacterium]
MKKSKKRFYYTVLLLSLFSILSVNLVMVLKRTSIEADKMDKKICQMENHIDKLREENGVLRKQIGQLEDGEYIEKIAREELGMVKNNEIALVEINSGQKNNIADNIEGREGTQSIRRTPSTIELSKKSVKDFFDKLFNSI